MAGVEGGRGWWLCLFVRIARRQVGRQRVNLGSFARRGEEEAMQAAEGTTGWRGR